MAGSQSSFEKATATIIVVIVGVLFGAVIGGFSGALFGGFSGALFGGVIGFVLLRQAELRRRLKSIEEASRGVHGSSTVTHPAPSPPPSVPPSSRPRPAMPPSSRPRPAMPPSPRPLPTMPVPTPEPAEAPTVAHANPLPLDASPVATTSAVTPADASPATASSATPPPTTTPPTDASPVTASPITASSSAPPTDASPADVPPSDASPVDASSAATPAFASQSIFDDPRFQRSYRQNVQATPVADSPKTFASTLNSWVTTGNVPVKVGVLVSLVGLGFLIQEANTRGFITLTVEMGLIAVALFGLALLAIGWRLRTTHTVYGLSLQGGGIASLFLTTFAAFAVYDVLGAAAGGAAVIVITVGAGALAVLQDARSLAVLGIIGGFLAPVLVYTQPEDHLALFGFYAVLSAAIVGVAWFKVWPELNLLGLGFTFGISAFWLADRYSTDDWGSTQPLIAVLILLYMAIPLLFAVREVPDIEDPWTAPLVFGTPFFGFGLQYLAIGHTEYGLAFSALALAVVQGAFILIVRRLHREQSLLAAAYTVLAGVFLVLAVPFALNAHFTSTVWAIQGAILVWFGCRSRRILAIDGGVALQILGGLSFVLHLNAMTSLALESEVLSLYLEDTLPIVNEYFLGAVVLAAAGLVSAYQLYRRNDRAAAGALPEEGALPAAGLDQRLYSNVNRSDMEKVVCALALGWGTFWWVLGGLLETGFQLGIEGLSASLAFLVASFSTAFLLSRRLQWPQLNTLGLGILPVMVVFLFISLGNQSHPFGSYGWAAWPLALVAHYGFLRLRESEFNRMVTALHAGAYWLVAVLVGVEAFWLVDRFASDVWPTGATLGAVLLLVAGTLFAQNLQVWPVTVHWRGYLLNYTAPVLISLTVLVSANYLSSAADPSPLPFLPVLNPLSVLLAALVAVGLLWKRLCAALETEDHLFAKLLTVSWVPALAVAGVVAVTIEAARSVHHWQDIPWDVEELAASTTLQASLSVIWAVVGLGGMVAGVRLRHRVVWVAGASFMALVVVKLFLVDLSNLTAVSRVVSFLGVGVLLLIVGYLAPVPPAETREEPAEQPVEEPTQRL